MAQPACNRCVQATPDCALLFIVAQVAGAPDADRSAGRYEPAAGDRRWSWETF
jgi:hypothetical protein